MVVSVGLGYVITRCLIMPERDWDDEQEIEQMIRFIMHGLSPA
jgi:hypothetical protein